ncbi:3-phosphoshikimate 1-carboxyvinyltransferase, partial [Balneolaceae bacterium ANBcel3]|nr:3-phosphoshikimate 1-carboxyvinyltransferase [Balneolaceae bacterium ANBcel3]
MNISVNPVSRLKGTLSIPPDKSIAQRAALFSLLSKESSVIRNYPEAEDPLTALKCIQSLGARVEQDGNTVTITGVGRDSIHVLDKEIYCGNSGTVMRLLAGILAGSGAEATLSGDPSLSARPMKRIIDPLTAMGAEIQAKNQQFPPLHIRRNGPLKEIEFPLPVASAQLKSCVLLAGLFGKEKTRVIEFIPSRNHTETMLSLPVIEDGDKYIIESSAEIPVSPQHMVIPGDFSAAAFWMVGASILEGSCVHLPRTGLNPTRSAAMHILQRMGADIVAENHKEEGGEVVADLTIRSATLKAVDLYPEEIPNAIDELPVLAVAMSFAEGVSRIRGAEELRFKESDRLEAMEGLLKKAGVHFESKKDGM